MCIMTGYFKKAILGTALTATLAAGLLAGAAPAEAHPWGYERHGGDGAGIAVAAGLIGLIAGAAIASDHGPYDGPAPVAYAPPPVAYAPQVSCYDAYPGYDGYCYPASYYTNLGWGWRDGGWWYGGARYARPFVVGGYRGGYGGGYRGGYAAHAYRGGYQGGGYQQGGGYRGGGYQGGGYQQGGGYRGGGYQGGGHQGGGYRGGGYQGGGYQGGGHQGGGHGEYGGDHDHR
jgi:hypothetical protein